MPQGHLRAQQINVQRGKIRKAIRDLDPSMTTRKRPAMRRRVYSVPYPNYLWHLDTNHKLIRWRFVTHHCIDCFSCLITFCHCSTNNKSETVLLSFNEAICRLVERMFWCGGIWRRLGERMQGLLSSGPVLNQRIEWHSQSVNKHELSVFKSEFYDLEREGVRDPLKETDLFCLHYVYLPWLKKNLTKFISAHNNHKILTEVKLIANWWAWELVPKRLVGRPTVKNKLWKGSQAALEAGTTPASSR